MQEKYPFFIKYNWNLKIYKISNHKILIAY